MPFSAEELANIANSALDTYINKGTVFKQQIQAKPMLDAFDSASGTFVGGKENVSYAVKKGDAGGSLAGYTHDDEVTYYNPATTKRVALPWKEMHIGITFTHTELKHDGINVVEDGADQSNNELDGREEQALANILDNKMEDLAEDYAVSMEGLIHGDGSSDTKAIAGIRSFILDSPAQGSFGGLSRVTNSWWRNRAATAAFASDGGQNKITSASTGGGVLLTFLQKEMRQLRRYAQGAWRPKWFAGSAFIEAIEAELRANGNYTQDGFMREAAVDGGMADVKFKGMPLVYDPRLDDLSRSKFCYVIDMRRVKLLYMKGNKMKRASPARPPERYTQFLGMTTTGLMIAQQLNTSGVYEIN